MLMALVGVQVATASCDSGEHNFGTPYNHICVNNAIDCQGDICETDQCNDDTCGYGDGFLTYCTAMCYANPGCNLCI